MSGRRSKGMFDDWQAKAKFVGIHNLLVGLHELSRVVHVPLVHRSPVLIGAARRMTSTIPHGLDASGLAAQCNRGQAAEEWIRVMGTCANAWHGEHMRTCEKRWGCVERCAGQRGEQ